MNKTLKELWEEIKWLKQINVEPEPAIEPEPEPASQETKPHSPETREAMVKDITQLIENDVLRPVLRSEPRSTKNQRLVFKSSVESNTEEDYSDLSALVDPAMRHMIKVNRMKGYSTLNLRLILDEEIPYSKKKMKIND